MAEPFFFAFDFAPTLGDIAGIADATFDAGLADIRIDGLSPIESAGPRDLVYYDNPRYARALATTRAAAVLLRASAADKAPSSAARLVVDHPYRAFARIAARLVPESVRAAPLFGKGVSERAHVDPTARLEPGVDVDPGAVIGPGVEIGSGTLVGANAAIGAGVRIGRDCVIGAGASLTNALLGDRVLLHPGVRIGQDGFGFAIGARGHAKVPQLGRAIIQDDVEIGANSTVDRGATRDTIVGEGTKIDNLVQIAHNVVVGRHCVIVAQSGVAGSTELGDFVMVGGQTGIAGHLSIGAGARIAAQSGVMRDVAPGASVGGTPAQDIRAFLQNAARARRAPPGSRKEKQR
ncbi:MAG: UDP-3-O-(3-hydroxymyristoyl)glucosamine N-acyltransferase [Hyphomicrobiales bacterium]|nr:UDP-3-O-(3-hydroxymyristoyl)glucosamine N-acyltransferase [Hyphomicrobiales bacterium]